MRTPVRHPALRAPELTSNTPIKHKQAHTLPAIFGGLNTGRNTVTTNAGTHIPQVSLDHFCRNLLPPLHPTLNVDRVIEELKRNGTIKEFSKGDTKEYRWAFFPVNPADSLLSENKTFAPFADIADAVAQAAFTMQVKNKKRKAKKKKTFQLKQRTAFYCVPNRTPLATDRRNTSMLAGYALLTKPLVPRRDITHWDNIAVMGEKKKHSSSKDIDDVRILPWSISYLFIILMVLHVLLQNNRKIQCLMAHSMRETVQRRFVFGYTIENASMRLWFGSRSDLLVSEQFDFIRVG